MVRPIGKTFKTGSMKPPKARTTCIYLDETRICRCEKSPRYTEKCFEATWCTYKTKGKYYSKQKNKKHSSSKNVREKIVLNDLVRGKIEMPEKVKTGNDFLSTTL